MKKKMARKDEKVKKLLKNKLLIKLVVIVRANLVINFTSDIFLAKFLSFL